MNKCSSSPSLIDFIHGFYDSALIEGDEMGIDIDRFAAYDEEHCWQYDIRLKNLEEDLKLAGLSLEDVQHLRCGDFQLQHEPKELIYHEIKAFIERHEWLGRMSLYPTNFFTARYQGILAGVVIMDMPTVFSKLLGDNIELSKMPVSTRETLLKYQVDLGSGKVSTRKLERLISRGACISWSPKNLASKLISFAIKWMVHNTRFRIFTAYSDTEAKELGTIYQACNFYYIGQSSGTGYQYKVREGQWTSDRYFRSRSVYKRIAKECKIPWDDSWQKGDRVLFDKMPEHVRLQLKRMSKLYQESCQKRPVEPKHKYVYILGNTVKETKYLGKLFEERNRILPYPKERGPVQDLTVLTQEEQSELSRLENVIIKGLKETHAAFVKLGTALSEIRDKRLYRLNHNTFESYCREKWDLQRAHAYRLIDAARVIKTLSPMGDKNKPDSGNILPVNERQIRPLARLEPEQQVKVWEEVVETAPQGKITAKHIEKVTRRVTGEELENKQDKIQTMVGIFKKKEMVTEHFKEAWGTLLEHITADKKQKLWTRKTKREALRLVEVLRETIDMIEV